MADAHDVVWTPEKVAATWDFFSERRGGSTWYFSSNVGRWIVKQVEREIGLRGKRILDFGCGRGDLLGQLFARGIGAEGMEFSPESAETTAERFAGEPLFGGVVVGSEVLPSESFDVVFLVEVIEHLLDDQIRPTLAEVRRVLREGGAIVVTAPNREDLAAESVRCPDCGAVFHQYQHQRSLDPASISALFEANGFTSVEAKGVYWGLTPYAFLRTWLHERGRVPKPHLLYIGRRDGAADASSDSST